jgi:hypothetical protein
MVKLSLTPMYERVECAASLPIERLPFLGSRAPVERTAAGLPVGATEWRDT